MNALCAAAPWSPDKDGLCTAIIFKAELAASKPPLPAAVHPTRARGTTLNADRSLLSIRQHPYFKKLQTHGIATARDASSVASSPWTDHGHKAMMPHALSQCPELSHAFRSDSSLVSSDTKFRSQALPLCSGAQSPLDNSCPPKTNNKANVARREENWNGPLVSLP